MSAQILELLFFAGVAFLVINKLIATLGSVSDEDSRKPFNKEGSYFGEKSALKDVTNTANPAAYASSAKPRDFISDDLKEIIVGNNAESIIKGIDSIYERLQSFNPSKFLRSAKNAFKMIIEASHENESVLAGLIDKRYLEQFKSIIARYVEIKNFSGLEAKISEVYMFGNNAFIKILFTGDNVINGAENLNEEWTFSRNLATSGPDWYLSNINKL